VTRPKDQDRQRLAPSVEQVDWTALSDSSAEALLIAVGVVRGLTYAEIGQRLDLSPFEVTTRMRALRDEIRDQTSGATGACAST
jgi:DNA-directed RNA polymerase specialized sigma24 family protein